MSKSSSAKNRRRRRNQQRDQVRLRLHRHYLYLGAKVRVECPVDHDGTVIVRHTSGKCEIARAYLVQDLPDSNRNAA